MRRRRGAPRKAIGALLPFAGSRRGRHCTAPPLLSTARLPWLRQVLYCRLNLRPGTNEEIPLLSERDGFARMRTRSAYRTARFFQLSFVLCWSPAFILSVFSFTSMKPSSLYPLFILQALTVSLQGFLNSLAYGWSRQNFRLEVTSERTLLSSSTLQKAFFEESLVVSEE